MPSFGRRAKLTDLGNLGGSFLEVIGFSEAGDLVGKALLPDEATFHAFLARNGKMVDLGSSNGNPCSAGTQVNLEMQIVGYSDDCSGNNSRALLWERGEVIDLNAFVSNGSGLTLTMGTGINERGEITVQGELPNGDQRAFLLLPCGEGEEGCIDATAHRVNRAETSTRPAARTTGLSGWRVGAAKRYHFPSTGVQP
jgi:hypothetical protein